MVGGVRRSVIGSAVRHLRHRHHRFIEGAPSPRAIHIQPIPAHNAGSWGVPRHVDDSVGGGYERPDRTARQPWRPSEKSPAFECRTKRPIGPIDAVQGLLSPCLSQKHDRQVTDHDGDAADRSPTVRGDRRGNGRDRDAADHQKGLDKPTDSSVGMVIGLIGAFRGSESGVLGNRGPTRGARVPAIPPGPEERDARSANPYP
jgi:hypothetical protein